MLAHRCEIHSKLPFSGGKVVDVVQVSDTVLAYVLKYSASTNGGWGRFCRSVSLRPRHRFLSHITSSTVPPSSASEKVFRGFHRGDG